MALQLHLPGPRFDCINLLREANEVAHKARETKQTVAVATHPENINFSAVNETDSESSSTVDASTEGISSALTNVGAQWVRSSQDEVEEESEGSQDCEAPRCTCRSS